ncbi:MAG: 2Fe-2S iron-sulfur cluster binding domain-containing protein [Spirochaetes bacterium]|nr:2Fe-2S iron-sulfur cluster binding domain-containing protein [Spirochaetota bacterium]
MSYLTAPVIVASLSGILAALITVIDRIVNNYGEVQININSGKRIIPVKGGNNLLLSLSENKIYLPSACGGRGSCGACKAKVVSDAGPLLPTEMPYLSRQEIDGRIRLSCQVKVKSDIDIEVPEELFNIKRFSGVVERITDLTHDIKEVFIKFDDDTIDFSAGQYAQLEVPPYAKIKESTQRAYSISSNPSLKNGIEFIIRLVPAGIVTTYVHNFLKIGEKVKAVGPFGDFEIRQTEATMVWVAGGSGMAPFKSMIYDLKEKNATGRPIWYFFGARSLKDLFYLEEMKNIEKEFPDFHFIPALSEPLPEDNWKGETGLITDVLRKYMKNEIGNAKEREGYLCGSPGMIDACVNVMTSEGIAQDKIYYDKFA